MTNSFISKVCAIYSADANYPSTSSDRHEAPIVLSQLSVTNPQSIVSKNSTLYTCIMTNFFPTCISRLFASTGSKMRPTATASNSFTKQLLVQLAVILFAFS
jgi:hypothetical protein